MDIPSHNQIVIIGAGPTGTLLALSLHQQGKSVLVIEERAPYQTVPDTRTLALSYTSIDSLIRVGINIDKQDLIRIKKVHISQQNTFGHTILKPEDINLPDLGGVIDYAKLIKACDQALINSNIPVLWESRATHIQTTPSFSVIHFEKNKKQQSITSHWCVLAEGGPLTEQLPKIKRRIFNYEQNALVATLRFSKSHENCAYEGFSSTGPLVLLPYKDQNTCRLVWTRTVKQAEQLLPLDEKAFGSALIDAFGLRLGHVESVQEKAIFPLYLKQLNRVYDNRVICIGNAAQTMHPVAAQGLNLGVRDAVQLASIFKNNKIDDQGLAQKYAAARRLDAHSIVGFTHGLITLFDQDFPLFSHARAAALRTLNYVPPLRKKFMEALFYGIGIK